MTTEIPAPTLPGYPPRQLHRRAQDRDHARGTAAAVARGTTRGTAPVQARDPRRPAAGAACVPLGHDGVASVYTVATGTIRCPWGDQQVRLEATVRPGGATSLDYFWKRADL